jgi:uncharacterized repeat protein (TIGR03803 family)
MRQIFLAMYAAMVACAFVQPVSTTDSVRFKEKVLWSFGSGIDGKFPSANMVDVNGALYGTTSGGGIYGGGTVFTFDSNTGSETSLYSFCAQQSCTDGRSPDSLISVKGNLYGTTSIGGNRTACSVGCGTVFSLDPANGAETVLYSFCSQQGCTDGETPIAGVTDVKGTLYGTTQWGGAYGSGVVFSLDRKTGAETVLYSFCSNQPPDCTDGSAPDGTLVNVNGTLYGTTWGGGTNTDECVDISGCGTVYSIDLSTNVEKVLYSFCNQYQGQTCTDGESPIGSLIALNGLLYGITSAGGTGCDGGGCGTVFSLDPSTGAETVLYSFCSQQNCTDGSQPSAGLIAVNGKLYGTTYWGGSTGCYGSGCGVVFLVDPGARTEKVLHTFCTQQNCTDGANPYAGLTHVRGRLYGTTQNGGAYSTGTVFALKERR